MTSKHPKRAGRVALSLLALAVGGRSSRCLAQAPFLPAPNASSLTTSAARDTLRLASFQQGELKNVSTQPTRSLNLNSVNLISPDEKTAIGIWNIPDGGGHMAVYDMATGKKRFHADTPGGGWGGDYIEGVAFAPDSKSFMTGWGRSNVRNWDAATGRVIAEFDLHLNRYGHPLAITPNGKSFVTGSTSGMVQLWDRSTGKEIRSFSGHTARAWAGAFSPDGQTLATCGDDHTARLWNVATGKLRFTLQGHKDMVYCLAFSHDGKILATGSEDKQIKLWETQTGREQCTLRGHKDGVYSLAFSATDHWLSSGSMDGSAGLWQVDAGRLEKTFKVEYGGAYFTAFLAGDTRLAVANQSTLTLWPLILLKRP